MAKKEVKKLTPVEALEEMKSRGTEIEIPGTGRLVRLRTLDAESLLREGKIPDILTPLVIKSVYEELSDREVRSVLAQSRGSKEDALAMMEAIEFVAEKSIADSTKVKGLTLGEKRWIFRLAMEPAELLVTFRYDPNADVEPVVEGDEVQPVAERDTEGK
jgi:hypothetical protein